MDSPVGLLLIVLGFFVLTAGVFLPRAFRRRGASAGQPGTFDAPADRARHELEQVVAELREAGREELARLDTKIRLLHQLLQDCDRKKAELEALLARPAAAPPSPKGASPLHAQVYALHDQGKDLHEICVATGLEKGEVELILGLRKI